jgi:hypothetical protein
MVAEVVSCGLKYARVCASRPVWRYEGVLSFVTFSCCN